MPQVETEIIDGFLVITVQERSLSTLNQAVIERELAAILKDEPARVILNLENVNYLDSVGLSVVVKFHYSVEGYGGVFHLCCVRPHVIKVLQLVQVDQLVSMKANLQEALKS